jgi:molybdate transport system substrate-binding protein
LVEEYESRYPNTDVELNIAGSGTLVTQMQEGAEADLIILASDSHMNQLRDVGLVLAPKAIARNSLAVIVSPQLAKAITSIDEVRRGDFQIAVCVESSPCGALALMYASSIGLNLSSATREPNVKAVLAKVERDEVDVGVVYISDVRSSRAQLGHLETAGADRYSTSYPLAVTADSKKRREAQDFAALFTEEVGQSTLTHFGFQLP